MFTLNLTQIGSSVGPVLPKEMLAAMKVDKGDKLYATPLPDGSFNISPYNPDFAERMTRARKIMKKYRNVLRELAK